MLHQTFVLMYYNDVDNGVKDAAAAAATDWSDDDNDRFSKCCRML